MKFFSAFVLKKSFTDVSSIKVDSVDEVDDHDRREEDRMIKNIFCKHLILKMLSIVLNSD